MNDHPDDIKIADDLIAAQDALQVAESKFLKASGIEGMGCFPNSRKNYLILLCAARKRASALEKILPEA